MGQHMLAAVQTKARCSPSTPTARVLQTFIVLRQPLCLHLISTATGPIRLPDWFYRATLCMGRQVMAAPMAPARLSPSTPPAQVLQTFIILRQSLIFLLLSIATGPIRLPDWFYRATPFMGRRLEAAQMAPARYLPSIPMAQILLTCIVSRQPLV